MPPQNTPITRALLSVSDKTGLIAFATFLAEQGVELVSTGGTAKAIREAGLAVKDVSELTHFPEMMDGRIKTLHPMVHGGLLAVRDNASHKDAMVQHGIDAIDVLVVNLYPFEATVAGGGSADEIIENIDIGGPAMLRAAAKNHPFVTVVTATEDYAAVQENMLKNNGATSLSLRKALAQKTYARTAAYDAAISTWFAQYNAPIHKAEELPQPSHIAVGGALKQSLRYGENPHQSAALYVSDETVFGVANAAQLQGKELSYNNIADTDAAYRLVCDIVPFGDSGVALIKHANPCGVAIGATQVEAFEKALACDPVSAYGGILAVNEPLDVPIVEAISAHKLFLEVIIAPSISDAAKQMLATKKNLRVLEAGGLIQAEKLASAKMMKSLAGGFLIQEVDTGKVPQNELKNVAKRAASEDELRDMVFAFAVCQHVASNAIVFAKDGATIGIGAGQMSRIDSVRIAQSKAENAGLSTQGSVLASDAFFPFDDNVQHAAKAGVAAVIQPGGSIRDDEVIAAADEHEMAMVLTGMRHFRH